MTAAPHISVYSLTITALSEMIMVIIPTLLSNSPHDKKKRRERWMNLLIARHYHYDTLAAVFNSVCVLNTPTDEEREKEERARNVYEWMNECGADKECSVIFICRSTLNIVCLIRRNNHTVKAFYCGYLQKWFRLTASAPLSLSLSLSRTI